MVRASKIGPRIMAPAGCAGTSIAFAASWTAVFAPARTAGAGGVASIGVTGWRSITCASTSPGGRLRRLLLSRPAHAGAFQGGHAVVPHLSSYGQTAWQIQPSTLSIQLYADKSSGGANSARGSICRSTSCTGRPPRVAEYTKRRTPDSSARRRASGRGRFSSPGPGPHRRTNWFRREPLSGRHATICASSRIREKRAPSHRLSDTASEIAGNPGAPGGWLHQLRHVVTRGRRAGPQTLRSHESYSRRIHHLGAADARHPLPSRTPRDVLCGMHDTWDSIDDGASRKLIEEAQRPCPPGTTRSTRDPLCSQPGNMTARINDQRRRQASLRCLPDAKRPALRQLIFHSSRIAMAFCCAKSRDDRARPRTSAWCGGSQNEYLNALTSAATAAGQALLVESSTLGNFALQWARIGSLRARSSPIYRR